MKISKDERIQILEGALNEIIRRSNLLIHQNNGRWNFELEHDKRSFNVVDSNVRIAEAALEKR